MKNILTFMLLVCGCYYSIGQSRTYIGPGTGIINASAINYSAVYSLSGGSAPTPATVITASTTPVAAAQWHFEGQQNANYTTTASVQYSSDWIFGMVATPEKETIACGWGANCNYTSTDAHAGIIFKLDHLGNLVWNVNVNTLYKNDLWAIAKANDGYVAVGRDGNSILVAEVDSAGNFKNGTPVDITLPSVPTYGPTLVSPEGFGLTVAIDPNTNSINNIIIGATVQDGYTGFKGAGIIQFNYRPIGGSGVWTTNNIYYGGNDVSTTPTGSSINKILTQSTGSGTYNIYACGEISEDGDNTTYYGYNADDTAHYEPITTFDKDIWVLKLDNYMTTATSQNFNKTNISIGGSYLTSINSYTYPYNETGPLTARNMDGDGNIKFTWNGGSSYTSTLTQYIDFNNNKNSAGYDMIFGDDGNLILAAGVNLIGTNPKTLGATPGDIIISEWIVSGIYGGVAGGAAPNFDEYVDCDGFLLKVNASDLSLMGAKNVGHFSGTDFFLQVKEDRENNFIVTGSTSDNYSEFGGSSNFNLMPDPGFNPSTDKSLPGHQLHYDKAMLIGTDNSFTGASGQNDLWRRSYLAADPRATQTGPGTGGSQTVEDDMMCVFALDTTADGGFVIGGNNSKNGDDFTVTKFAPVHQNNMVSNTTASGFTNFAGGYGGNIPATHTVSGTETWSTSMNIATKVVIPSGARLDISSGTYSFASSDHLWDYSYAPNAYSGSTIGCGIVVQPGGILTVASGVILQSINAYSVTGGAVIEHNVWDGVVVQGTPAVSEVYTGEQGRATLTGTTIKDARYALFAADNYRNYTEAATSAGMSYGWTYGTVYNGTTNDGGGVVTASGCTFQNCNYGAVFENYGYPSGSSLSGCTFTYDATGMGDICYYTNGPSVAAYGGLLPPTMYIGAWGYNSLLIQDNTFTGNSAWPYSVQPLGIAGYFSGLNISKGTGSGNTFSNLTNGIITQPPSAVILPILATAFAPVTISNNTFTNNLYGVSVSGGSDNLIIQNNNFNVMPWPVFAAGINMAGCHGYDVSGNTFGAYEGGTLGYAYDGIQVNDGTPYNETINDNTFNSYLVYASIALQENGSGLPTGDGLQYRCNTLNINDAGFARISTILGTTTLSYPATLRYELGHYNLIDPTKGAGNLFLTSCVNDRIDADDYVMQVVNYYNNYGGSNYDPAPCFSSSVTGGWYMNIPNQTTGSIPSYTTACTPTIDYTDPVNIVIWGSTLSTLDAAIADPGTSPYDLTEYQAEHDQTVQNMVRYYTLNNDPTDAAALLAGYNMYRDAIPCYLALADYTDAQTMLNNMLATGSGDLGPTADDTLYAWESQLAINLMAESQNMFALDTGSLDSLSHIAQYNTAAGYTAGAICALLGISPVTWPMPVFDTAAFDSLGGGGGGSRRANGNAQPVVNVNSQVTQSFSIFPNPTYGALTATATGSGTFYVYTIEGQLINQYLIGKGSTDFTLSVNLAPGIYMGVFKPVDGSKQSTVRLINKP